ncbi:hypothetical protein [Nostoc sp. 'Peltigera membranacea cyanobiont' N6]|uniref:hypothetical protein n=1 Tax=Nostoc sp. 'Peltigera membranacea cyanobiont' N6 TaxID=1261031 RepID=UPI000CF30545|nr:hypothetical protein [Nostoc sp. 'Peltigera membranacea cyanobiont' N6]AVH68650.1 chromosome segregation protein Smc [Nostoc sp. 'Peltigera membranacea cyanobiont' N6]
MNNLTPISLVLGLSAAITVAVTPNENVKFYGTIFTGIGVGGFLFSQWDSQENKKQIENLQKTVDLLDKQRRNSETEKLKVIRETNAIKSTLDKDLQTVRDELSKLNTSNNSLKTRVSDLENELKLEKLSAQSKIREISNFSTGAGHQIVTETYKNELSKLGGMISGYSNNYPDLKEFFENLEVEIDKVKSWAVGELEAYQGVQNLQSLIDEGLRIQQRIISRCSDIKVKALTTIIKYLNSLAEDSVKFSEYQDNIAQISERAREHLLEKELAIESIAQEWITANTSTTEKYSTEFTEVLQNGKHLVGRIQELSEKIELMNQPLKWSVATRQDLRIGNIIISYFEAKGLILDRAKCDYDHWQSTLSFHIDRNNRIILPSELEPEGERLQQLCHTLSPLKFGWNAEEGLLTAWLHLAKKPVKPIIEADINKIWKTADRFQSTVKSWSRVRITGGSESGKSPTAENLAVCILLGRGGSAELYNPQDDSVKNFWTVPTVGSSHNDSLLGIEALAATVNQKTNDRSQFKLTIFDEIDSTIASVEKKSQSEQGKLIATIIKQVSHQNLGAIFIGQNANAKNYPGMDRSDWNSAVNLHIGSNAYDAISNSNQITTDEQTRLKQQADKLTEFCTTKNSELGLELTNPVAYRFGLVLGDGKPYYIQLPDFGTYTYGMVENAVKCPKCDSHNHIGHGGNRRKCKDCGHIFTQG